MILKHYCGGRDNSLTTYALQDENFIIPSNNERKIKFTRQLSKSRRKKIF